MRPLLGSQKRFLRYMSSESKTIEHVLDDASEKARNAADILLNADAILCTAGAGIGGPIPATVHVCPRF